MHFEIKKCEILSNVNLILLFSPTFVDKTLEREDEILDIAVVTDIFDQNEAVESLDEALEFKL